MSDGLDADAHFAIVPEWLLDAGLPSRAVHLYGILRRYADGDGRCFPARSTLAQRLGCSLDTLDRTIAALVEAKALTVKRRRDDKGGLTSNLYTLRSLPPQGYPQPVESVDNIPPLAATVRLPQPQERGHPSRTGAAVTRAIEREPSTSSSQRVRGGGDGDNASPLARAEAANETARRRAAGEACPRCNDSGWAEVLDDEGVNHVIECDHRQEGIAS